MRLRRKRKKESHLCEGENRHIVALGYAKAWGDNSGIPMLVLPSNASDQEKAFAHLWVLAVREGPQPYITTEWSKGGIR